MKKYLKVWWLMSRNSFLAILYAKIAVLIFLSGKILKFSFFVLFLYFLVSGSESLAGYNVNQAIFFFLTFNLLDVLGQFLFREVYRFRQLIVSGDFDLILVKPISALFRSLLGGADIIDLITVPPLIMAVIYVGHLLDPSILHIAYYILLVINGLIIAAAFHIAVLAFGIVSTEVDHAVFIYRDLMNLGRLPVGIYREPIKSIITYLVPVGIMITVPARGLMGLVSTGGVIFSLGLGLVSIFVATKLWNRALKLYTSASS